MTTEVIQICFGVNAEGMTELLRSLWQEGQWSKAYRIGMQGFGGMDHETFFAILSGSKKFIQITRTDLDVTNDDWTPPEGYKTPSIDAILNELGEWERLRKNADTLKFISPLVYAASGNVQRMLGYQRSRFGPGSPVGIVTTDMVIYLLTLLLPEPTDEQWEKFWEKYESKLRDYVADRSTKLQETMDYLRGGATSDVDKEDVDGEEEVDSSTDFYILHRLATGGDPLGYVKLRTEMEKWKLPAPDLDMKSQAGYVLPDGTFYPCIYMAHNWLVNKLAAELKLQSSDPEKDAEQKWHWVRLNTMADGQTHIQWSPEEERKKPTRKQMDAVMKWASIHKAQLPEWFKD